MRIAVVSDIHGNLPALEAVVRDLERRGVDRVVNLGDNLSGPLLVRETARYLMAQDWVQLAGNHERQLLALDLALPGIERLQPSDAYARAQLGDAELAWLATLPPTMRLSPEILLCHGTPSSDITYFLETLAPDHLRMATPDEIVQRMGGAAAQLILCGHTHIPRAVRAPNGTLIVNPGSVGLQAYDDDHPYFHQVENGSPDARYAIVEQIDGAWVVTLIAVPYDAGPMAALALRNGRPEWAHALLTGYGRQQDCATG